MERLGTQLSGSRGRTTWARSQAAASFPETLELGCFSLVWTAEVGFAKIPVFLA